MMDPPPGQPLSTLGNKDSGKSLSYSPSPKKKIKIKNGNNSHNWKNNCEISETNNCVLLQL